MPDTYSWSPGRRRRTLLPSSTSRPHTILNQKFSIIHRSQSNADESIELPHKSSPNISQHSPRTVEVAGVQDKQVCLLCPVCRRL